MQKNLLMIIPALLIIFLTACGDSNEASKTEGEGSGEGELVNLVASNWEFEKEEYKVSEGKVTINLKNKDGHHGITIDNTDLKIDGEGKATANLEAGEYIIRCSIPCGEGHQEMTAKLVVE